MSKLLRPSTHLKNRCEGNLRAILRQCVVGLLPVCLGVGLVTGCASLQSQKLTNSRTAASQTASAGGSASSRRYDAMPAGAVSNAAPPQVITRLGGLGSSGGLSKSDVRVASATDDNDQTSSDESVSSNDNDEQNSSGVVPQNQDDADYLKYLEVDSGAVPPPPKPGIPPLPTPPQNSNLPSLQAPAQPPLPADAMTAPAGPGTYRDDGAMMHLDGVDVRKVLEILSR